MNVTPHKPEAPSQIEALVERYFAAFNARDYEAALECYYLPFTWLFGSHAVSVVTREDFLTTMAKTSADLRAKGLANSELHGVTVRMLGEKAALAGIVTSRRDADGNELQHLGASYLVQKGRDGWRLVANVSHPVEAIVPAAD